MSPNQRKLSYALLLALNVAAAVCSQQALFPATWAHGLHVATMLIAMMMKEFSAPDAPAFPAPPAKDPNAS